MRLTAVKDAGGVDRKPNHCSKIRKENCVLAAFETQVLLNFYMKFLKRKEYFKYIFFSFIFTHFVMPNKLTICTFYNTNIYG